MLGVLLLCGTQAGAEVTTDQAGSIVIYPKVIADGTRDTLIQLTNTSNMPRFVHCLYVNAASTCTGTSPGVLCEDNDDCEEGQTCVQDWQETNFGLVLTRQQPTIWRVSTGRLLNLGDEADGECDDTVEDGTPRQNCPGFDPGNIINPVIPFRGELKCIEVDESDVPAAMNSLKGEAILETLRDNGLSNATPQISKYNAINIRGNSDNNDGNLALDLDNEEYNACPEALEVVHYANLATDPIAASLDPENCDTNGLCAAGDDAGEPCTSDADCDNGVCMFCPVRTEITLIPCSQNFENALPTSVQALFQDVFDEEEEGISSNEQVTCWMNQDLSDIGDDGNVFDPNNRTTWLKSRIVTQGQRCIAGPRLNQGCDDDDECGGAANGGVCGPASGLLGIIEEFHYADSSLSSEPAQFFGTAATNMHMIGSRSGRCRGDLDTECDSDANCEDGFCRASGAQCINNGVAPSCPCGLGLVCDTQSNTCVCDNTGSSAGLNTCDRCLNDRISVPDLIPFECANDTDCGPGEECDLETFTCVPD
jgi:hypothetical protein